MGSAPSRTAQPQLEPPETDEPSALAPDPWYTDFFETVDVATYENEQSLIIYWPRYPGDYPDPREPEGWGVIKIRRVYERLSKDHPRIVKCLRSAEEGSVVAERFSRGPLNYLTFPIPSVVVERLSPGPLKSLALPTLTVPVLDSPSLNDNILLSLYYRWALQALSVIGFLHSHSIFIKFFSWQNVWVRSNLSIAITGFLNAELEDAEDEFGVSGHGIMDERFEYWNEREAGSGSVKEDLYWWATFVWRLMTNDFDNVSHPGEYWEPVSPPQGGLLLTTPDVETILGQRYDRMLFQELEDARLGRVLIKAWKSHYEDVGEAIEELRTAASTIGIAVVGDEVGIDGAWEDFFEIIPTEEQLRTQQLKFRTGEPDAASGS